MHKPTLSLLPLAACSLLAAACGPVSKDLAELQSLAVLISAPSDPQPPSFEADIVFAPPDKACAQIHATATLNGVDVPLVEPGGGTGEGVLFFSTRQCFMPKFALADWSSAAPDASGLSTLVITDESKTVTASIRNLGVPRTLTLVSPADGVITSGTHVTLAWSPSTDVLDPYSTTVDVIAPASNTGHTPYPVTIDGSTVTFDMPAVGTGTFDVAVSSPQAGIASCDGALTCVSVLSAKIPLQVQ